MNILLNEIHFLDNLQTKNKKNQNNLEEIILNNQVMILKISYKTATIFLTTKTSK
jgi:hypothetical protein